MEIREDNPGSGAASQLLHEHLCHMRSITPPGSVHAFEVEALCAPDVTFWTAWIDSEIAGCGALLELDTRHGEIKSMRTAQGHRRKGVAGKLLRHIIGIASARGYERISLETGAGKAFGPAHALYDRFSFQFCEPFGPYQADPNSVFMTRRIFRN